MAAATEVQPADIASYMTNVWDLGWVLDDAGQRLALSLGPEAFDEDKSAWAMGALSAPCLAWRLNPVAHLGRLGRTIPGPSSCATHRMTLSVT